MVKSTESKWGANSRGKVSHTRDALGRITSLDRQYGMYSLYAGGGIRQTFDYTAKGALEFAQTATLATPGTSLPGRTVDLGYDKQGNRKKLQVDGLDSHLYTPGPANEYTAVSYQDHVAALSGMAENPGQVVAGAQPAERQGDFFYRGYSAESVAEWTLAKILAAAPPSGSYVTEYAAAEKEVYLPSANVTPQYDSAGNLTNDGRWTYIYDGENRLIRQTSLANHPDYGLPLRLDFEYDYLGRRVRKTVTKNGGALLSDTGFAYWEWHLLAEVNLVGSPSMQRHYVWGLDKEGVRPGAGGVGGLLMLVDHPTSKTYYAMNDYLGNVIGLLDASNGSVTAAYEFDPFGRELRATGTYADQNPFRFSSQYSDTESGNVYFGFRYYHPQWGRFINRDPIEEAGGENLYRFVSNDPVNRWDWLGLDTKVEIGYTNTPVPKTNHALVILTDTKTGMQYASRAGPSAQGISGSASESSQSSAGGSVSAASGEGGSGGFGFGHIQAESGPYDQTFRDNPNDVHTVQEVGTIDREFSDVVGNVAEFEAVTNKNEVPYTPATNSNSYAFTLTESLTGSRPDAEVSAPGAGNGEADKNLSYGSANLTPPSTTQSSSSTQGSTATQAQGAGAGQGTTAAQGTANTSSSTNQTKNP